MVMGSEREAALEKLINAVIAEGKAGQRLTAATARVRLAMENEDAALAEMQARSPPPSFMDIHAASVKAYSNK
jgi:hypothetical protein